MLRVKRITTALPGDGAWKFWRRALSCMMSLLLFLALPLPMAGAQDAGGGAGVSLKPAPDEGTVPADKSRAARLNVWTAELDRLDKAVSRAQNRDVELSLYRSEVESILTATKVYETSLAPDRQRIESQLRGLGPAPTTDGPKEVATLSAEREKLNATLREIDSAAGAARVLHERARQLVVTIQAFRRQSFMDRLFERSDSGLSPTLWSNVVREAGPLLSQLGGVIGTWVRTVRGDLSFALALAALGLGYFLFGRLAVNLVDRYRNRGYPLQIDLQGRATSAAFVSITRALPPILAAATLYLTIFAFSELPENFAGLALVALQAFAIFAVVKALTQTVLATQRSEWRMVPLGDAAAGSLRWYVIGIAAIYSINLVMTQLVDVIFAPQPIRLALSFITSLALAILLLGLVRTRLTLSDPGARPAALITPFWLKIPLFATAIAILAAAFSGYFALAQFLSDQVVVTGSILATATLAFFAVREFHDEVLAGRALPDRSLPGDMTLDATSRKRSAGIMRFLLNAVLACATAVLITLQWGFDAGDLAVWFKTAFFGFEVGAIRISIAAILIGIGIFIAGMVATRLVQRSLAGTVLSPDRMSVGLAHSIRTGIGYAGFALSALVAVSYAGFNFTNLAIVAGALSVGIGFGLQSIVNNFVSGLILLAERPIQVGDWIVVGDKEGYVRQISVRATIIETFDRASLIIPNSDLMTAVVTNWTYGNNLGRVIVRVGTSYDTDPRHVSETLLEIGRACSWSLAAPAPTVAFENFGASTLDFSLRVYIANINNTLSAQTELRMEIWRVFRERGIEISFPQLDVNLKQEMEQADTAAVAASAVVTPIGPR